MLHKSKNLNLECCNQCYIILKVATSVLSFSFVFFSDVILKHYRVAKTTADGKRLKNYYYYYFIVEMCRCIRLAGVAV